MTISTQATQLSSDERDRLQNLLDNANARKLRQLQSSMAKSVREAISDADLTAANVQEKIAGRLRDNIPEITHD